jgi:hypothetical protein
MNRGLVGEQVMSALAFMHQNDRLHQSLGPSSVLLSTKQELDVNVRSPAPTPRSYFNRWIMRWKYPSALAVLLVSISVSSQSVSSHYKIMKARCVFNDLHVYLQQIQACL